MLYQTEAPYLKFTREQWEKLRCDMPLTLTEAEINQLRGQIEAVSMQEVVEIYLPLSRLLNFYVSATQSLHQATQKFLGHDGAKVPYIIGVTGSVAVGKSLSSRLLQALLSRWPNHPNVALVTTDGFLYPNAELEKQSLSQRKGFPESFDTEALLQFLIDLKAGKHDLKVPTYSHHSYDIVPNQWVSVDQPDIVIIEGLNILQAELLSMQEPIRHFISDFIDFSIYVDAKMEDIREWFLQRFMLFRQLATKDKKAFFYQFGLIENEAALRFANEVWENINETNLVENILPYKERADLVLCKKQDHSVHEVWLKKL